MAAEAPEARAAPLALPSSSGTPSIEDCSWADRDDWIRAWDGLVAAIGVELEDGPVRPAADPIEISAVRRYLEPLEFDCPLHHDADVARSHGYSNVVAPYSGLVTWAAAALWQPGDAPVWVDSDKSFQPPVRGMVFPPPAPVTDSVFQTDVDHEFVRPIVVGDHLGVVGRKVLACTPKQTSVGRGAFVTWQVRVLDRLGDSVALIRRTSFFYVSGTWSS
jgi:hypothetical protein